MKKLFLLLALPFLAFACNDEDVPQPRPKADMTVMAYLVADASRIEDDIWTNIAAMYDGLATMDKSATLLVYWDGSGSYGEWSNPVVLRYETDGRGNINGQKQLLDDATVEDVVALAEVIKEYPSQISTDINVMSRVLKDMVSFAPTEKIGLIAGSHGSAWVNSIYMHPTRSFGQDGKSSDNTILTKDMAEAMKSTGRIFEFLLFDACYMATAEVCYDFKDITKYQISSVLEIPAYGFPYENIMKFLYEGTINGYINVCRNYIQYYKDAYNGWGTISLIDCKEMQGLANSIKKELIKNKDILANYLPYNLQEYGRTEGMESTAKYISVDIVQFIKQINENIIPEDFLNQFNKVVLYTDCLEEEESYDLYDIDKLNYSGLGIYVPVEERSQWNEFFKTIDWYTAAGWNEVTFSWGL